MKKITVLCMLFLTITSLHGMKRNLESEQSFPLGALPIEAKAVVTQEICTYDNLDAIVATIDAMRCVNKEFNNIVKQVYGKYTNLTEFTTLVHLLSDKFPDTPTEIIANKFKIPVAQKYMDLGNELLILSMTNSTDTLNDTKQIIAEGADVNFTTACIVDKATGSYYICTPILFAFQMNNLELIKLLLTKIKSKTMCTTFETSKKIDEARSKLLA